MIVVLCGSVLAPVVAESQSDVSKEHVVRITASQYGYQPYRIVVDAGDTIRLSLVSIDVVHGLYLEGHDLEAQIFPGKLSFRVRQPSSELEYREVPEVLVKTSRPGKYRYRCSVTCGTLHPFMQGELIVRSNSVFRAGTTGAWMIGLGLVFLLGLSRESGGQGPRDLSRRVDLLHVIPGLRWFVTRRWFQFAIVAPNLIILIFFIFAGLAGSPIGNRNIIVTIVWIFWWFLLITILVPLGGRAWCMACPLPIIGEWAARRRLVETRPGADASGSLAGGSLNRRWPRKLRNLWIPNLLFLGLCSFSTILVTRPALTAVVLLVLMLAAITVHLIYWRRTFCRYLCPLNAWMSVYSMTAVTEIRTRDAETCRTCRGRSCMTGTDDSWPCPWLEQPFRMDRNNYCGLCMECVKACPNGNPSINLRPFCSDTKITRLDEAFMVFIMMTLVIAYSVTLLGPWGFIRSWANVTEIGNWIGFGFHAAVIWVTALAIVPGIWLGASWISRRLTRTEVTTREIFTRLSYVLVPLGLMAWIAFSVPLVMVNYTHILGSLSDPLGWGWDLFGTAQQPWAPLLPEWIPPLQVPLLLFGLAVGLVRGFRISADLFTTPATTVLGLLPHSIVATAMTTVLLRLLVG